MKKKTKYILLSGVTTLVLTATGTVLAFYRQETQDQIAAEKVARDLIQFNMTFHKFPEDKINKVHIDKREAEQIIQTKAQAINNIAKPDSDFYKSLHSQLENAIYEQANMLNTTSSPNVTNAESQKIIEDKTKKYDPKEEYYTRSFGGYAENITILANDVKDNEAHVNLTYIAHSTSGQWQHDHWVKASPSAKVLENIDVQKDKDTGKWYVVKEQWDFADGSGP